MRFGLQQDSFFLFSESLESQGKIKVSAKNQTIGNDARKGGNSGNQTPFPLTIEIIFEWNRGKRPETHVPGPDGMIPKQVGGYPTIRLEYQGD